MAKDQNVILEIDGDEFFVRNNVEIISSMTNICNTFTLVLNNITNGDLPASPGKECSIKIDDEILVTGYIDIVEREYNPTTDNQELTISGRDKTADLIDCTFEFTPNEWKESSVLDVLTNICNEFDINVFVDSSVSSQVAETLETYKMNFGEYVVDAISELALNHGFIALSTGDGRLTLTQAGVKTAKAKLSTGSNIIWSKSYSSNLSRYSSYTVKGHGVGNDNKGLIDFIEPGESYSDGYIDRERPLTIFANGPTDGGRCALRAQWEACLRAGLSNYVIYEYDSFYQDNTGDLWRKNTLVKVSDTNLNFEGEKLISSVSYVLRENDLSTYLTLVDPATFSLGNPSRIVGIGE